jgi:hypothetical protein
MDGNFHPNKVLMNIIYLGVKVKDVTFQHTQMFTNMKISQHIGFVNVWLMMPYGTYLQIL